MNCPDPETLSRFHAGTLSTEEAEAVRQHLNDCPACAAFAAGPPTADEPEAVPASTVEAAGAPPTATVMARPECPSREELRGYLDGSLSGERRAEVRDHIADCDDCFETIRELRQGVETGAPAVPEEVAAATGALVRTAPAPAAVSLEAIPVISPIRQVLSHAAVAVAAVAVTLTLAATGRQESPRGVMLRTNGPPGYATGPRAARPDTGQPGSPGAGGAAPGAMGPGRNPFGPGGPGAMGTGGGRFGRGFGPGSSGMPPGPGMFPGGTGMPPGFRPGMSGMSPGGTAGGFGPLGGSPRFGIGPGRLPPSTLGSSGPMGMTGGPQPRPGMPGSSGVAPAAPTAVAPPNLEALLPVHHAPTGVGVSGDLAGTPEATEKALRDAAELARSRGPAAAAANLEEFSRTPANQSPEVYTFLSTLYMNMGDRERAAGALQEAQRRLELPATPETPPAQPGTNGGAETPH
jgi:anti-sigma factor RsiW